MLARVAAGLEVVSVLLNLLLCLVWFASLVLLGVGLFWALVAVAALIEGALAVRMFVRGEPPVGIAGPLLGLAVSLCNVNMVSGTLEMFALAFILGSVLSRTEEPPRDPAPGGEPLQDPAPGGEPPASG